MLRPVDDTALQAAIKALKINVPIYSAIRLEDGSIQIVTRNGIQTWTPAARVRSQRATSRKTHTPAETSRTKAHTSVHTSTGGKT